MKLMDLTDGFWFETNLDLETEIADICFDSREVTENCAFFCLKGSAGDGHEYIPAAKKAGSAVFFVEDRKYYGENCVLVKDAHDAISRAAGNFWGNPARKMKLIGVTGTNGKTSVTYILKQLLDGAGFKSGLIGTVSSVIGEKEVASGYTTPPPMALHKLFYDMHKAGCEYVVMEVSSHSLDQKRVGGLLFEIGIFTNLTQDHLDYHKTMENYLAAKAKLFSNSKLAILNYDDEACENITAPKILTYSAKSDYADFTAKDIKFGPGGVSYILSAKYLIEKISVPIPGMFSVYNSLAAAAAAITLGVPAEQVSKTLETAHGVKGRIEVVPANENFTVLIDYAHTPDGLYNVLGTVKGYAPGRLVVLFGCGGDRDKGKRPIMGKTAADLADFVIVTSDNPRTEPPDEIIKEIVAGMEDSKTPRIVIEDRKKAIEYAINNAKENDTIVLAGKGHETYQILKDGKIHFDEREIVAEILKNR